MLWPACLDVAALVAGLAAIRARRRSQPDHYAEALMAVFSLAVIAGNVVLAGADPVAVAVQVGGHAEGDGRQAHQQPGSSAGSLAAPIRGRRRRPG